MLSLAVDAQSKKILEVFKLLPPAFVFDLTRATRDSMLLGKTYYPPTNDSEIVEAYNYGNSNTVEDYIYVSLSYETTQRATALVEIRSFAKGKAQLVIVSRSGGIWRAAYHQQDLSAFLLSPASELTPYNQKIFPATDENVFFKKGIPDTVRKNILANANTCFDFSGTKVQLKLNANGMADRKGYESWLKGDCVEFTWTGDQFRISRIWFE